MIERQNNVVYFVYDECLEVLNTEQTSFQSAVLILREEGWMSFKAADEWRHKCSECSA